MGKGKEKQDDKVALIGISDLHINCTVGLCAPSITLDDGGEYRASREQRQLWEWFLDFCDWAKNETRGYRRIGFINGDMGELDTKRRSVQIITANKSTIISMVLKTIEPFLSFLDRIIVIRGTPAHTGKGAWLEEAIANDLTIVIPSSKTKSHYQYRGVACGVRFDIAHHSSSSPILPWTRKSTATKLAVCTMYDYLMMNDLPPNVVVRSHNHTWVVDNHNYPIHAYLLPAWTYPTEYWFRVGQYNGLSDIGGGIWLCENGEYTWRKRDYKLTRTVQRIWTNNL